MYENCLQLPFSVLSRVTVSLSQNLVIAAHLHVRRWQMQVVGICACLFILGLRLNSEYYTTYMELQMQLGHSKMKYIIQNLHRKDAFLCPKHEYFIIEYILRL